MKVGDCNQQSILMSQQEHRQYVTCKSQKDLQMEQDCRSNVSCLGGGGLGGGGLQHSRQRLCEAIDCSKAGNAPKMNLEMLI